jgi:hypothetical protein
MPDGLPPLAYPALPAIVARPSRETGPVDRRRVAAVLLLLGLLHVIGALLVDAAMRLRPALARLLDAPGVAVRLIDPVQSLPANPPAPAIAARQPDRAAEAAGVGSSVDPRGPAPEPVVIDMPGAQAPTGSLDTARLFDPDGSPRLSPAVIDAAGPAVATPDFAPPKTPGLAPLRSPLPYKPTRFEAYWVPVDETLGDEWMRRLTMEKEFKTPWGTRWRCTTVLLFGACSDVPPAPMKNRPTMPWETYDPPPSSDQRDDPF